MKKFKLTKETISLIPVIILSVILNFINLGIEGYGNSYYAAAVKSMTMSLKNFFFVSFDPTGFVTIDKPPIGFWLQAISAKIFGFSGVSILLPEALAGVISVILIYHLVKKSFGHIAGFISALCLAITPVFVAVSRNNTIDNLLVMVLLFACWVISIAAEKGKFKYLILSMILVGVGFNIKMLQAYMIVPALYITYLFSTAVSVKKQILHLFAGTLVLIAVSMSWALVVDSIPASSRPYIDSSTNNTVSELIFGHNGAERISLSNSSNKGGGGAPSSSGKGMGGNPPSGTNQGTPPSGNFQGNPPNGNRLNNSSNQPSNTNNQNMPGNPPTMNGQMGFGGGRGNMPGGFGGNSSTLQGSFGSEAKSSILRLFSKNILSDQIVWFIPLAVLGFIAAAIKEKLGLKLDNKKKQALSLWFFWFFPEFIYFSFNTGTFHSYYLTMLAPPIAALAGIGISSMWELYKEGGWKSWFLPITLMVNGAVHLLMLYYFISSSSIIKVLMVLVAILCFVSSIILCILNVAKSPKTDSVKLKKIILSLALVGLFITPFIGSSTVLFNTLSSSFPAAGLELLSSSQGQEQAMNGDSSGKDNVNSKLITFLLAHKTTEKYLLVVSSSNSAADIIIKTGESVMSLGGFLGSDNIVSLNQFKQMVKNGEIRYVMIGGQGGGNSSSSEIMTWVKATGKLVSANEYSDSTGVNNQAAATNQASNSSTTSNQQTSANKNQQQFSAHDGNNSFQQLYDLKSYTDSASK